MSSPIRIAGIEKESVCDGPGIRFVVFAQGCFHRCEGCHNPRTHDPEGGYEITVDELLTMVDANPLLDGVTLSGGDPFLQAGVLAEFASECRRRGLSVIAYTGFLYEEIVAKQKSSMGGNCRGKRTFSSTGRLSLKKRRWNRPFAGRPTSVFSTCNRPRFPNRTPSIPLRYSIRVR